MTPTPARADPDRDLLAQIRVALAEAGDPDRAQAQQAYMKSALPYYGVALPQLRKLVRSLLNAHPVTDRAVWDATVREMYDDAGYREDRYAAIVLARHRMARAWQDPDTLDLYRHLVVTGAWWDLVDETASHLVGGVLASHRGEVTPVMRAWAVDGDTWLRRTAVLCQLRHAADTDTALLHQVIADNVDDRSFWLRKAIGWALRQYSRTDPDWVRREVDALGPGLSGLSRREALRNLP